MKNTDMYKLRKDFGALKKGDVVARRWTMCEGRYSYSDYYCRVIDNHYDYNYELHLKLVQDNIEFFASYLFTTKDGIDIYEDVESIYAVVLQDYNDRTAKKDDIIEIYIDKIVPHWNKSTWMFFSTKKAAENYLLLEEAKKRYPIGTKIKCLYFKDDIDTISSHEGINSKNEIWFKVNGRKNMLVYCEGNWAEIVKLEVGKWYSYKDKHFIKYERTKQCDSYSRIHGETINTFLHNPYDEKGCWTNSEVEKNCTLLEDLSIIQQYLPDGHVDKKVDIKVGDWVTTNSGNIYKVVEVLGSTFKFLRVQGTNSTFDLPISICHKATNEEIIAYYESLGWVKGARFTTNDQKVYTLERLNIYSNNIYCSIENNNGFREIKDCNLIRHTWEECYKGGYLFANRLEALYLISKEYRGKNVFRTQKQAESALAFAQLSQIVAEMNEGWVADWSDDSQPKFIIKRYGNTFDKSISHFAFHPLCFKSRELRDFSLNNHYELWKQYYELN